MMHVSGYLMALAMGLCLGLMGSGGSILTVPVLVYMFRLDPVIGTSYSLFIVGATSLAGLLARIRTCPVHLSAALAFALPSLTGVYLVRGHVIHNLPDVLPLPGGIAIPRDAFIMTLFAIVMMGAAWSMLHRKEESKGDSPHSHPAALARLAWLVATGLVAGALTGFVGAGGGFLIVPALVLIARLPMENAVGSSLAIITAQSFLGFSTDWRRMEAIDWPFLFGFSLLSILGALLGGLLGRRLGGDKLRNAFGGFILILALAILAREFFA